MTHPAVRAASASESITAFAGYLRDYGLTLGVGEVSDMVTAAELFGHRQPRLVSCAWRSIACRTPEEWAQWPDLFERFWHPNRTRGTVRVSGKTRPHRDLRAAVRDLHDGMAASSAPDKPSQSQLGTALQPAVDGDNSDPRSSPRAMGGASRTDPLHDRSGTLWWPDELVQLQLLARRIYRDLRPIKSRRFVRKRRIDRLDVRATLRNAAAHGGDGLTPIWRTAQRLPPRIFIFVDVSRSMEAHAAYFLRVARAFVREANARVFVFHTKIIDVTALLQRDSGRIQEKINAVTAGFGGGTRIASCLSEFAHGTGRSALRRGARIWIMSDGYDTDEPAQLLHALKSLRRNAGRVVWFHPTRTTHLPTALSKARSGIDDCIPLVSLADLRAQAGRLQ